MQEVQYSLPKYKIVEEHKHEGTTYWIVSANSCATSVPKNLLSSFEKNGEVTDDKVVFLTLTKAKSKVISEDCFIKVDADVGDSEHEHYLGDLSDFLSSAHKFDRREKRNHVPTVEIDKESPKVHRAVNLAESKNKSREWANGRGDVQGVPQYFKKLAQDFALEHGLRITTFSGDELFKEGFRCMHAVGRGSINEPVFINLAYEGNPDSDKWTAFVGKGVCFDTGGYNIKPTAGIKDMFLDKHGSTSVFSAFQTVVIEKLPINLTCSIGMVENFVSHNAFRPMDIIKSRKGLTVEIGNTDAQGRLVLCDCMHWTQEKFKVETLIEESTLTGAMIVALGHSMAGVYSNNKHLAKTLRKSGDHVNELLWEMPVTDYHVNLMKTKHADLTNHPGKGEAGAAQAAAFLKCFVEEGVNWAHIDIAGTAIIGGEGTGYGARVLVEYVHQVANPILPH